VTDALRLAFGTLTVLPVRPPRTVDRRTAGRAMVLAPVVALVLGLLCAALLAATAHGPSILRAALCVALLALFTRGMHLDGLADTADGLGSGKPPDEALAVMRRGDVGPFGVVTLALVLLVQVAALAGLIARDVAIGALPVALLVSRAALPLLCSRGVPAARPDGLGNAVAGSVTRAGLLGAALLWLICLAVVAVGYRELAGAELAAGQPWSTGVTVLVAATLGGASAVLLAARCVRRLGGVTGDVLGAAVEVSFTVCLVVLALA
jgi:adenosylcobinamide-GDP ribazoletransferase